MEYLFIAFAYISLFISLFWLQILALPSKTTPLKKQSCKKVSLIIPAYNAAETLRETLQSALRLDYPKNKLEIIVVNDGSTDATGKIARSFKKYGVKLVEQAASGSAAGALNGGLKHATGELFARLDADSLAEPDALQRNVMYFDNPKMGAVVSAIKVHNPKKLIEKFQWFEYLMAAFIRKLLAKIGVLFITPGVLTVYRTNFLKKSGGFDETNLTEDFEMAMRLHYNHYDVTIETQSIGYTVVPQTLKVLFQQRVRWFRGFIYNALKYKDMFFNKNYGMLGMFQLPVAILSVFMLLTSFFILAFRFGQQLYYFAWDFINLQFGIFKLLEWPTIKTFLNFDFLLLFPIGIALLFAVYFLYKSHRELQQRWKYPVVFPFYLLYYSLILACCWATAVVKESVKAKKKW